MAHHVGEEVAVRDFHIDVPEEKLVDLRRRIEATQWPEKETVADESQGVPLATMQELARYWATDYDWRRCEAKLKALPQFITEIDGLDIHFIHVRSKHENALPLIVTHGWPGSIIEQLKTTRLSRPATLRHPVSRLRNGAPTSNWTELSSKSSTRSTWRRARKPCTALRNHPSAWPPGFSTTTMLTASRPRRSPRL